MTESFIEFFHFSTAIPFGYAIFGLIWLYLTGTGALALLFALFFRRIRIPLLIISFCALFVSGATAYSEIMYARNLEMIISFNESDLVGTWIDESSTLELNDDFSASFNLSKSYESRMGLRSGNGTWGPDGDFIIILGGKDRNGVPVEVEMRVIKYNDQYRLIIEFIDPGFWDGKLGFKKMG